MTRSKLFIACIEARRFLDRAQQILDSQSENRPDGNSGKRKPILSEYVDRLRRSKGTGAVRRASMDLTRALAELRKSSMRVKDK